MRIVIIDDSGLRATVLEEGLRDAGYDDGEIDRLKEIGAIA